MANSSTEHLHRAGTCVLGCGTGVPVCARTERCHPKEHGPRSAGKKHVFLPLWKLDSFLKAMPASEWESLSASPSCWAWRDWRPPSGIMLGIDLLGVCMCLKLEGMSLFHHRPFGFSLKPLCECFSIVARWLSGAQLWSSPRCLAHLSRAGE